MKASESLGTIMVNEGMIDEAQLTAGLAAQRQGKGRLGECLVSLGILTEAQVMWALARQLDIPYIPRIDTHPEGLDQAAIARLPGDLAHQLGAFPLFLGDGSLTVVMEDPLNALGIKVIERVAGVRVKVALSDRRELLRALRHVYREAPSEAVRITTSVTGWGMGPELRAELLADESGRALLDWIIDSAREMSARDLRFFATEVGGEVRVRGGAGPRAQSAVFLSRPWYAQLLSWLRGLPQGEGGCRFLDGIHGQSAVLSLHVPTAPQVHVGEESARALAAARPGLVVVVHPDAPARDEAVVALCRCIAAASVEVVAFPDAPAPEGATRLRRDSEVDEPRLLRRALAIAPSAVVVSEEAGWCLSAALRRGRPQSWLVQPWAGRDATSALLDLRAAGLPAGNLAAGLAGVLTVREGRLRGHSDRPALEAVFIPADEALTAALLRGDVDALQRWERRQRDDNGGGLRPLSVSA